MKPIKNHIMELRAHSTVSTFGNRVFFFHAKHSFQSLAKIIIIEYKCIGLSFNIIFSMYTTVLSGDNCSVFFLMRPQMDFTILK